MHIENLNEFLQATKKAEKTQRESIVWVAIVISAMLSPQRWVFADVVLKADIVLAAYRERFEQGKL
jgi:hypothetical protein